MMTRRVAERLAGPLRRFSRAQNGTVGLLFALAAIPAFALAGGVIDYVTIQNEHVKLQNAADAAVLAAMKSGATTPDEARDVVINYLKGNYRPSPRVTVNYQDIRIDVVANHNAPQTIHVEIPAKVRTTFWGLVGVRQASLNVISEATQGTGGLEVVMVLDVTGSMDGSKIEELKLAAKDLIDELQSLADNPQIVTLKVGMVPYASHVNVGTEYANASWLDMSACCNGYEWNGWVGSRPEPHDISDENFPAVRVPASPSVVLSYNADYNITYWSPMPLNIQPITPLQDLTDPSSVTRLKNKINSLSADGWTYIPGGLVWGWRVLSPQEPFPGAMRYDDAQNQQVRKVVILMTDGSNTCHNVYETRDGFSNFRECGFRDDIQDDANNRMRQLCEAMHARGILIASVAYEVTDNTDAADTIRDLMQSCGNFGYYTPQQGELRDVFRNIAQRLTRLHLSR